MTGEWTSADEERRQAERDAEYDRDDPTPSTFEITWADETKPLLENVAIVRDLLAEGEVSVVYGPWGSGKTFAILDILWHVAIGAAWQGRKVRQTPVLYMALEGRRRFCNRVAVIRDKHGHEGAWLAYAEVPIDLRATPEHAKGIIATAKAMMAKCGVERCVVVIDTLTRALRGGSDCDPNDVGMLLANVDAIVRGIPAAHVVLVHHPGKDTTKGARGWSGLSGAIETELKIERNGEARTLTVSKQRDGADGQAFGFTLEQVILGHDEDGEPVTSCTVEWCEPDTRRKRPGGQAGVALEVLAKAIAEAGELVPGQSTAMGISTQLWRRYCDRRPLSGSLDDDSARRAFGRVFDKLRDGGFIETADKWVWLRS